MLHYAYDASCRKTYFCFHSAGRRLVVSLLREEGKALSVSSKCFFSGSVPKQSDRKPLPDLDKGNCLLDFYPGPSTDDSATQSLIQNWFQDCIHFHKSCTQPWKSVTFKPTRVLELRHDQQPVSFRLVQGSQCPYGAQYITLSHCWGPQPAHTTLRLLESTTGELSQWQPVKILPKTFRDAVVVAERFKVRYLWIDRLCIYQDSADDWRHESSTMQHVYRNALLNVSALGAHGGDDGLFFSRLPWREKLSPAVEFRPSIGAEAARLAEVVVSCGPHWFEIFNRDPLVRRGWVLQERLLAPRVLHFGTHQAYWECRQGHRCEMAPRMENERTDLPSTLWKTLVGEERPSHQLSLRRLSAEWRSIVQSYTKCDLTFPGDKLIALSGLAEEMKEKLREMGVQENRYMAGIWHFDLENALTWYSAEDAARRAHQYRAPSWSWAALDGPILLDEGLSRRDAYLVAAEINTPPGGADTGELTGGSITLSGQLGAFQSGSISHPSRKRKSIERILWHTFGDNMRRSHFEYASVIFDTVDDITYEAHVVIIGDVDRSREEGETRRWVGLALASAGAGFGRKWELPQDWSRHSDGTK